METVLALQPPVGTGLLNPAALSCLAARLQQAANEAEVSASLRAIRGSINQLQALELQAISAASRLRAGTSDGLVNPSVWLARESRQGGTEAARSVRLAASLEALPQAQSALAQGSISVKHAEVIAQATRQLPAKITAEERDRVEAVLTEQAKTVDPLTLRKASRRAVEIAGRSITDADEQENQQVRTAEEAALLKTRLSMHDNEDGTTTGHFTVPTFAGAVLRKAVQQIAAPRREAARTALEDGRTWTKTEDHGSDWAHKYGLALVELLEHLPTDRLHGKVAATVVITMDLDQLRGKLKVANTDIGEVISVEKARQLACNAGLVPTVLNGASVPLDLGRSSRFFSQAQRTVLATQYDSCATAGCDRPYAWSELHHQIPWQHGGTTDLAMAIPLCGFHHRMIHHDGYRHSISRQPDGSKSVTFTEEGLQKDRGDRRDRVPALGNSHCVWSNP